MIAGAAPGTMRGMRPATTSPADLTIDVAGFLLGIGMAWAFGWQTADLVWGLWLSSLVLGYASLLAGIAVAKDSGRPSWPAVVAGKLFLVVFFTLHFGLFHFVHSVFLHGLHPVPGVDASGFGRVLGPGVDGYVAVFQRYWPWLLAAAIAERAAWWPSRPRSTSATAADAVGDDAAAAAATGTLLFRPYLNVIRMHVLIFFFLGAAAVGLQGTVVYVVVYAVYFLPWRVLRPRAGRADAADGGPAIRGTSSRSRRK